MSSISEQFQVAGGRALKGFLAIFLALAFTLGAGEARAGSCPAEVVVKGVAGDLEAAAREGSVSAYTRVLQRHVGVTGLALFALGPYRRNLSGNLKSQYISLATQYMGRVMADNGHQILNGRLVIEDCFAQNGAMLVRSRIGGTHLDWRVSGRRISDVKVEGIWLALTLRSTFVQVLRDHNGDPQALIRYLGKN